MIRRHPRAKRLTVILNMAEKAEKQALAEWGQLQQQLQKEQDQQQQLDSYVGEYQRSLALPSERSLTGGAIHNTLSFLYQVQAAVKQQAEAVNLLRQRVDASQEVYLTCHGKVKALNKLLDKLDLEYEQESNKQEQRQADEWANRAAFHIRKN